MKPSKIALAAAIAMFCFATSGFGQEKRTAGAAPTVKQLTETETAALEAFPEFRLIPTTGTGMQASARADSGAFFCHGWVLNEGAWIYDNKEYRSKLMILVGNSADAAQYSIWDHAGNKWSLKVAKKEHPGFKDHSVWITPPSTAEKHFGYFVNIDP